MKRKLLVLSLVLSCHFASNQLLAQNTCVENGTLLFIETFDSYHDGLSSSSPAYATTPLPAGMTTYTFVTKYAAPTGLIEAGTYALYKGGDVGWPATVFGDDHTYPGDITKGRMLATNGKSTPDLVYKQDITDLCAGTELYFSFWMRGNDGLVKWKIYSKTSNVLLATFGPISNPGTAAWKFYGYDFTLPAGETAIRFEIWNDDTKAGGNDLAYDDIAVYLCTNKVNVMANGSSSTNAFINRNNKTVNFEGSYVNDAKFGTTLTSYWLYSTTGDITSLTDWTVVDTKSAAACAKGSTWAHNFSLTSAKPGYYRLIIGSGASILTNKCRAASNVIYVQELPDNIITDPDGCLVEFAPITFNVKQKWSATGRAQSNTGPLVGDLDGDGIPEIVTLGEDLKTLFVTNGASGALKATLTIPNAEGSGGWHPVSTAILVDADANGRGEIIIATSDLKLNSYEVKSGGTFALEKKWGPVSFENIGTDNLPQPIVADFNGDGIAELVVYNQIYNAATGEYLGKTEAIATAYVGRNPDRVGNQSSNFMTASDFDGDGLPEIAAGGKVYKVNISGGTATCSILYKNTSIPDGFTATADVDLDGNLDVVVVSTRSNGTTWLDVWSPTDNRLIHQFQIYSNPTYNAQSYPFIGDIDGFVDASTGKKYPEICVTIVNKVIAYKYNSSTKKYSEKWTLNTTDASGGTGITLFDFNNDGINELIYRDQTLIRILNGVKDNTVPVLADATASITCNSGTAFEYPVIADIDGDGSANICVTCSQGYGVAPHYLRTYESNSQPWAPTRQVWNQVSYEPTGINNDLTVPNRIFAKQTAFVAGGKEYHPYNGALIQVPIMDINMKPVVLAPDPYVISISFAYLTSTTVSVSVTIGNQGQANVNASLPVSLYAGSISTANLIETKPLGVTLTPGNTTILTYDVPVTKLKALTVVRIQDDGTTYPAPGSYNDCNRDNNTMTAKTLMAVEDFASPEKGKSITVDVLANDMLGDCTESTIMVAVATTPTNGTAVLDGKKIKYTPNSSFYGTDKFTYKITCDTQESTATVNIIVNSLLIVEKENDAQEPNIPGKFIIKFEDSGYLPPLDLEVSYTITPSNVEASDYTIAPTTGKVTIIAGQSSAKVTVTPNDNYKVEGNNRELMLTITGSTFITTP